MNISQLESKYPNGIPDAVQEGIAKFMEFTQKKKVQSVELLPNFGKDVAMSLKYNRDIYKGLVVKVSEHYELSEEDRLWFHPDISKGRSLFKLNQYNDTKVQEQAMDDFGSTISVYSTHNIDEIGSYNTEQFGIVDNGKLKDAEALLDSWILARQPISMAYSELTSSKLYKDSQKARDIVGKDVFGAKEAIHSSNYVMLYSDATSYYFYNHAIKPKDKKALVHISPLMGYALLEDVASTAIESDYIDSGNYINPNNLGETQRKRAFVSCSWTGENLVNTFTMAKPLSFYKEILEQHQSIMYRMESGKFSHTPIQDKLDMDLILYLTPKSENIPREMSCSDHHRQDIFRINHSNELLNSVMSANWQKLLKPEFFDAKENKLVLPRSILQSK